MPREKTIRERVEELVKEKPGISNQDIAKVLKDEGYKSKRGKPLAANSVQFYKNAQKQSPMAPIAAERKRRNRNPNQAVMNAAILLLEELPAEDRVRVIASVL
jgi:uncharacterized protein YdaT